MMPPELQEQLQKAAQMQEFQQELRKIEAVLQLQLAGAADDGATEGRRGASLSGLSASECERVQLLNFQQEPGPGPAPAQLETKEEEPVAVAKREDTTPRKRRKRHGSSTFLSKPAGGNSCDCDQWREPSS